MKTVYKSKVDKGLLIAIIAIVLLSYLPLLFEFSWIALALLVVTAAFIADPFCNTSYTIDNGTLHIIVVLLPDRPNNENLENQ